MYKVILVDDEIWVIESLKRSINWNYYGFEVVDQAGNGAAAFEKIKQLKPDLVFADIRMPGTGGLELIAQTSDLPSKPLYIIVSGFAEFAYAQKAMSYGAIGYCLKPFDVDEIGKMLLKATDLLGMQSIHNENDLIDHLDDPSPYAKRVIEIALEEHGLYFNHENCFFAIMTLGKDELSISRDLNAVTIKFGVNKRLYITNAVDLPKMVTRLNKMADDIITGVGISERIDSALQLGNAVEQASIAAYQYFVDGTRTHHHKRSYQRDEFAIYTEFDDALHGSDPIALVKAFENIAQLSGNPTYTIRSAYSLYNLVTTYLYGKGLQHNENLLMSFDQLTKIFRSNDDMIDYLRCQSLKQYGDIQTETCKEMDNMRLKEIIEYVDRNFYKDISIHTLAQKFHFNPNYFCQLFSKGTGVTFTEYLTRRRIEYACEILSNSKAPVGEVAEKCGFDNYFYFSRIFKKLMQRTPSEYRSYRMAIE